MTKTKILKSKDYTIGNYSLTISLEFCIKDLWFGVYWENEYEKDFIFNDNHCEFMIRLLDLYFIIIPTLPIHFCILNRIEYDDNDMEIKKDG